MMMNRKRLNRVMAVFAIVLSAFFLLSFIFLGVGTNISYNVFELFGKQNQPQQQANQGPSPEEQISQAKKDLEQHPKDPEKIKTLAALYYNAGRYDDAVRVLQKGREAAPKDAEIPALLGQVYTQQAQTVTGKKQKELQSKAGDAFAASAKADPGNEQTYLLAGQAYDQAGKPADAIEYYNKYLDRAPNGETSRKVKDRITALLQGGGSTGSAQP